MDIDPQAYLDRYLESITCDWCGQSAMVPNWSGGYILGITRRWRERVEKRTGYSIHHWRIWKVCTQCELSFLGEWSFAMARGCDLMLGLEQKNVVSGLLTRYYADRPRPDPEMPVALHPPIIPFQMTGVPSGRVHVLKNRWVDEAEQHLEVHIDPAVYYSDFTEAVAKDMAEQINQDMVDAAAAALFHVEQKPVEQ